MADKLTPQQQLAVENRGGALLVSAAAGSGKTKVLVDRLMGYLMDPVHPANLDDFLIITYTKAAASELRGKIAAKLGEKIAENPGNRHLQQQMQRLYLTKISTVHAFCSDLLRENAYRLDISADFRVGDENECRELRENAMTMVLDDAFQRIEEDANLREFVDTQGLGRTDALVPTIIMKVYDSARCHLDPEEWLQKCVDDANMDGVTDPLQTIWGSYLADDLRFYLEQQIAALTRGCEALEAEDPLGKPATLLRDTVFQLERLRNCNTWDEIVANSKIDYGRLTFPGKLKNTELADQIKAIREACKKGLAKKLKCFSEPGAYVLEDLRNGNRSLKGMISFVHLFSERYDALKKSRHILDFGDLEHRTLDLLLGRCRAGNTRVAGEIGLRFREILVDEYQDSNAVQDAIFTSLTQERHNLFMVGDVKQSIYQFRLADPGIFLEKYAKYVAASVAVEGQGRTVVLSKNFRSCGAVLDAVNDVFRSCMSKDVGGLEYGDDEALYEGIPHQPLGEPEVEFHMVEITQETYPEEAAYTAAQIQQLLDGKHMIRQGDGFRPIRPEDIVILLRSPGSVGQYYQNALDQLGIRCTSGGGGDLLKTPEIQVLRSLLQTISNPRQDIPLTALLLSPVFGFTADDLARIRSMHRKCPLYDALLLDSQERSKAFVDVLKQFRSKIGQYSLAGMLDQIFTVTRIDSLYAAMDGGEQSLSNLQQFFQLAVAFESGGPRDLNQFLSHLEALERQGIPSGTEQAGGAVTVMSIHKSKGLEFPVVFLCGLSREFNRESLRAQVLCDQDLGIGLSCVDVKNRVRYPSIAKRAIALKSVRESLSEELRVLYVAMTRAKDRLIMTYAAKKPEAEIKDIALRSDFSGKSLMTRDVICPGEWVLYEVLHRTEAGVLHVCGGKPGHTHLGSTPWAICLGRAPQFQQGTGHTESAEPVMPTVDLQKMKAGIQYRYPYAIATVAPSKLTATALKGRQKDQEAAENTAKGPIYRNWRKPGFVQQKISGAEYGTAVHKVLRYIQLDRCRSEEDVMAEIARLTQQRILSDDEAALMEADKFVAFFKTDFGQKVCSCEVLREFKFSILEDAGYYQSDVKDEKILLQGVVDCAIMEPDGITIVDFKTDRVTDDTLDTLVRSYQDQVNAYARAISKVFQKNVKAAYLYFFHTKQFIRV